MPFILIDDSADLPSLRRALARDSRIALDCEAAGFHRYSDRLSLLQITTSDTTTLIVDPLAFDPGETLRGPLGDPAVEVLMHGADYDLRLLDRDLDVLVHGLFDTQVAAGLLGESSLGLAALLDQHLGVKLSKKYQRADWGRRPLPDDMLAYAAADTRHLRELGDLLRDRLARAGRLEWALEECRLLEETRWTEEPNDEDPVVRVRGARDLAPREVTALRAALKWRDRIARERDRAPFRVAGDQALLEVVVRRPRSAEELAEVRGMSPALARQEGAELIEQLDGVDRLPDAKLVGYPRRPPNRSGAHSARGRRARGTAEAGAEPPGGRAPDRSRYAPPQRGAARGGASGAAQRRGAGGGARDEALAGGGAGRGAADRAQPEGGRALGGQATSSSFSLQSMQ